MTLELVKCPYCGYKFRTDVKAREAAGETTAIRSISDIWKPKLRCIKTIDFECPNCKKMFEYQVE